MEKESTTWVLGTNKHYLRCEIKANEKNNYHMTNHIIHKYRSNQKQWKTLSAMSNLQTKCWIELGLIQGTKHHKDNQLQGLWPPLECPSKFD